MDPGLLHQIRQCQSLPTLPAIAVQVLELVRDPNAQIPQLARLISKDPALASKILRTVNSSLYARPTKISKLTQALSLLGLQTVRVLVLGFSLVRNLKNHRNKGFKPLEYWRRAIYSATSALTLAQRVQPDVQEEAFVAALLMDMGMLVLDEALGEQYGRINEKARTHIDLVRLEEATFQSTHAEVSGYLAETWGLPATLAVPMKWHHKPASAEDPALQKLAQICCLAGRAADIFVEESASAALTELHDSCSAQYQISPEECDGLLSQISKRTAEIAPLFEINVNTGVSYESILRKANESVIQFTLADQQHARIENDQLRQQASADALTGLATRGKFHTFLPQAVSEALKRRTPLTLILLDIDHFKAVNDKYGHQRGDVALKAVAKVLSTLARPCDLAARYGGEEMALIIPGAHRATAAAVAESIRKTIASFPPAVAGVSELTVSIGVATLELAGGIKEPAHLLKAADMALYAAKNAGRNCVRVFSGRSALSKPAA
jgi:two-component system cell cycle response regulator